ncbi:hypothetical protein [Nostoc sp.]
MIILQSANLDRNLLSFMEESDVYDGLFDVASYSSLDQKKGLALS